MPAGRKLLAQEWDGPAGLLAERFRSERGAVLLGVQSLWEGVDFPGETLELLVVAKLPFSVPDDPLVEARGERKAAPRDNVIFELGLFMGALGRARSFIVRERGVDLKIPTDLLGVTSIEYESGDSSSIDIRMAPACELIRRRAAALGAR